MNPQHGPSPSSQDSPSLSNVNAADSLPCSPPLIRFATDRDELTAVYPFEWAGLLNPDKVLVAVHEDRVVAALTIFDGGHSVIFAENMSILPTAPRSTGARMYGHLRKYCLENSIGYVLGTTKDPDIRNLADRQGMISAVPHYYAHIPIRQEDESNYEAP